VVHKWRDPTVLNYHTENPSTGNPLPMPPGAMLYGDFPFLSNASTMTNIDQF
jgi:hypothetical protein